MTKESFIFLFSRLGDHLRRWINGSIQDLNLDRMIELGHAENPFFTPFFQRYAISAICDNFLSEEKIEHWLGQYDSLLTATHSKERNKKILIIMAGNIPFVGFHDFMCAALLGGEIYIKCSSKDRSLFPYLISLLGQIDTHDELPFIRFIDKSAINHSLSPDAIIMMGSNSSGDYIEKTLPNTPSLIRKERISIAVLKGDEDREQIKLLSEDIITYYGLGCRSVAHLLVPCGYDLSILINAMKETASLFRDAHFQNIYLKNRALLTLSQEEYVDSPPFIFVKRSSPFNPLGIISYYTYLSNNDISSFLSVYDENIQKIYYNFGVAQKPELDEYPDNQDTLQFLLSLFSDK